MTEEQLYRIRQDIQRATFYQPLINNNIIQIYNIKESDVDRAVNNLRRLEYLDNVRYFPSGKYDFSRIMGGMPSQYYIITANINKEYL